MDPTDILDGINCLVHFIIDVNSKMQLIIWKGGLLQDKERYMALRAMLPNFNLKRILDFTWEKINEPYICIVLEFISEYAKWIISKTTCISIGLSRINNRSIVKRKLSRVNYDLDHLEESLYIFLKLSITMTQIYIRCA